MYVLVSMSSASKLSTIFTKIRINTEIRMLMAFECNSQTHIKYQKQRIDWTTQPQNTHTQERTQTIRIWTRMYNNQHESVQKLQCLHSYISYRAYRVVYALDAVCWNNPMEDKESEEEWRLVYHLTQSPFAHHHHHCIYYYYYITINVGKLFQPKIHVK